MYDSAQAATFWQDEKKWKATRQKPDSRKEKTERHSWTPGRTVYVMMVAAMAVSMMSVLVGYVWTLPETSIDPAAQVGVDKSVIAEVMTDIGADENVIADIITDIGTDKNAAAEVVMDIKAGKDNVIGFEADTNVLEDTVSDSGTDKDGTLRKEALIADVLAGESTAGKLSTTRTLVSGIPVIVVDAGHGGEDEGCSRSGIKEKDINLAIALLVEEKLTAMGYQVIMTRDDDSYMAVEDRVRIANENRADLYISIHQNAYEDTSVHGIEVWYDEEKGEGESKRLALLVGQQTVKRTEAWEREFRGDSEMYGVVRTTMPACLIETGFLSNAAERAKLVTPEYQEQIAQGIAQGIEYYFHPKTMYLTFDDGPRHENTGLILDILKERNIKATFFVIGESVRNNPELARRIVEEGHAIGIHCNNHDYKALYQSVDSYVADFEAAHQAVLEVTGVDTKMFRFPGGSRNAFNRSVSDAIIQEMTARGYIYYDWNASLEDAVNSPDPEQMIANAVETTFGRKKVIMLAHDSVRATALCLEELLDRFPEYKMEALTEEVEPVQF